MGESEARGIPCSAEQPLHSRAAIIVPCIEIERLTIKCIEMCHRLFPAAEIIVVADSARNADAIDNKARVTVTGPVTISAKRNTAARETNREILAFIDSDAY